MKNLWKHATNQYRQNKSHKPNPRVCGKCLERLDIEYEGDKAASVECPKCGRIK